MRALIFTFILSVSVSFLWAQDKIIITKAEELPKHSYELHNRDALDIVNSRDQILELASRVKKDLLADLEKYDIKENATLRDFYGNLSTISQLEDDYSKTLVYIEKQRKLADKESKKVTLGMNTEALIKASQEYNSTDPEKINSRITQLLIEKLDANDFELIQEDIEAAKGYTEIYSENFFIGIVQGQIQTALDNNPEQVPGDLVMSLINLHSGLNNYVPYKEAFYKAYDDVLKRNAEHVVKKDIWKEREVAIGKDEQFSTVVIAVWDTGVDMPILPTANQWINENEKFDGKDTDGNGFIDDVYGIAYDLEDFRDPHYLNPFALDLEDKKFYQDNLKGLMDLQANINSEESSKFKTYMAQLKPEEVKDFLEKFSLYSIYAHGTHVSGIVIDENEMTKVLSVRFTADHKTIPTPVNQENVDRAAKNFMDIVDYLKENEVRVVNMSWGAGYEGFLANLELNGIGKDDEERKTLAKSYFTKSYKSFKTALESSPEILFVCAAGNSDDDVDFAGTYPSSLNLPNLITVGAVDIEGKKAGFTTEGESVDVYANGYEVASYVPGGDRIALSGTSMASPNVANLAGKLLAVHPDLKPEQVIEIIKNTSTVSEEDEKVLLIHPKKALKLANKYQLEGSSK